MKDNIKTTTSINYSKDTFLKTYELDRTKVYQVEKIPDFHVLRKHPNTLLRELSFNSPYIIKYYNIKYDINEQTVYTVLEKLKGTSLDQFMDYGCPSFGVLKQIIFRILKGYEIIHDNNLLHRNVCMNNILVEFDFPSFNPKISGFPVYEPCSSNQDKVIAEEEHLAPEVQAYSDYNMRSEVWAIGLLVYQTLNAKYQSTGTLQQITDTSEIDISIIPTCFKNFILRALSQNPENRPENARQLNTILYQDLEPSDQLMYDMLD